MNELLKTFANTMHVCGLQINYKKSNIVSLIPSGKEKKMKVLTHPTFKINGHMLKQIGVVEGWKYLGIQFEGTSVAKNRVSLINDLERITKAPLIPQQRMTMLATTVIPRYLHVLVLGRTTKGRLETLDSQVRMFVRRWLHLPKDVPLAFFYASVKNGGLGITRLTENVPLIKRNRLANFLNTSTTTAQAVGASHYIQGQVEWCDRNLSHIGENVTKVMRNAYWEDQLESKYDTKHLSAAKDCPASTSWVRNKASEISAQDYIHYTQIRAGCLPTRTRTSRGRNRDRMCRARCMLPETNYHVVQQCHRTHGGRILRHDRIVKLVAEWMGQKEGYAVQVEPRFTTPAGLHKPDLLITRGGETMVIDAQIVSGTDNTRDHITKKNKYMGIPSLDEQIKASCGTHEVSHDAITISYKGIIGKDTNELLNKLGINEHQKFILVTSTLRGTWLNWTRFNQITTMRS